MKNLRQWDLHPSSPYAMMLAADARISQTSYTDDQIWQVDLGSGDQPALGLHTKYGGRAGLASLIPVWTHEGRSIYQALTYHSAPVITAFTAGYIATQAEVLPDLHLHAEHLALTSQVMGGIYTLTNQSKSQITIRFDLFGHLGRQGKEEKLAIVTLASGGYALSLSAMLDLRPIVIVEHGTPSNLSRSAASPRIGIEVTLEAGQSYAIRFVHSGQPDLRSSLSEAQRWLVEDWTPFLDAIDQAAQAIPSVQTGNKDWDAVIESAYVKLVQAFLRPAGNFPRETFVTMRLPEYGHSANGDGSDHPRGWSGQHMLMAYLLAPVMAGIHPAAAVGIVRNYIAIQESNGHIDLKPGAAGQRRELLATPLLARITLAIYEKTEDRQFLRDSFPALLRFFDHWLTCDADEDGIPEWQDDRQTGYVAFPTFAPGMVWAQGAAIQFAETPDLLAYLLSEADALRQIATYLEDDAAQALTAYVETLKGLLDELWGGNHYTYRDRDTNITTSGMVLLEKGIGDQEHHLNRALVVPNRLVIRVVGGVNHIPNIKLVIDGKDRDGQSITETADQGALRWQNRQGIYTSRTVFTQVDRIRCEGLSRVYRIFVRTMDTTGLDINAILPLWTGLLSNKKQQALAELALSKDHFLRENGFTMVSAQDERFDPSNAEGAGGVWMVWQTLLGEALLHVGESSAVADVMKNILKLLDSILTQEHEFSQFYHADKAVSLGEKGHLEGIVPLKLFEQLVGVEIVTPSTVRIAATFGWGRAITIRQHGVYVRRTSKSLKVEFASGKVVELKSSDIKTDTVITDDEMREIPPYQQIALTKSSSNRITIPQPSASEPIIADDVPGLPKIIIEVEIEE